MLNPLFWKGRKVFVTGHTGFKGSWLCMWLKALGADVIGYALNPATSPNLFTAASVGEGMYSIIGDICDAEGLSKAMSEAKPDVVIHMAAQALVRYSYQYPVETYSTNVMGTVHLLEAVRRCDSVLSALVVTSDKCYENQESESGYREDEPVGGFDPYSNSKGCAELAVSSYRQSFFDGGRGMAIATARAGNVIAGGDWAEDRLIPDMVRAFTAGEVVTIRNPKAVRPWQHLFEALHGYLLLLEQMDADPVAFSQAWNFGPEETGARDVQWIVENFVSDWGDADWEIERNVEALHEAQQLRLDCSKSRSALNWQPVVTLEHAMKWTAEWYRCFYDQGDVLAVSKQQLEEFQAMAST